MIDYKLTPNEKAKLEIYMAIECTLYDGAQYAYPDMTNREAEAVDLAVGKQTQRLYNTLGMAKIFAKMGMTDR
tara:strand:+ start:292 stop:510 length:219 start_codon:yes stop_codon:yes gene_type:complete